MGVAIEGSTVDLLVLETRWGEGTENVCWRKKTKGAIHRSKNTYTGYSKVKLSTSRGPSDRGSKRRGVWGEKYMSSTGICISRNQPSKEKKAGHRKGNFWRFRSK